MSTRLPAIVLLLALATAAPIVGRAQAGRAQFSTEFSREEFAGRRARIYDAMGGALGLLQGAPTVHSSTIFRQSNEFFYVTGVVVPQAYLVLDGRQRKSVLYLPAKDERRAQTEGDLLTPDQADEIVRLTGIESVRPLERLTEDLKERASGAAAIYTPFQPAEGDSESRDGARRRNGDAAADPWDGRQARETRLIDLIKARVPGLDVRDLSPILDEMRAIKSPAEIAVIERATKIGGEAILEAMRSTEPGVKESEIDALAQFVFVRAGAQGEAYRAIVASGPTALNAHHRASPRPLPDGELVIMDYCPDLHYYRCDVTRMWPVNGKFNDWQRELYGFYLGIYEAILYSIKPGVTGQAVLKEAIPKMDAILAATTFSKPEFEKAARGFVDNYRRSSERPTAGLGHGIGMSTHDMGGGSGVMRPGLSFTIEPQFRVPEAGIYIRLEDMIVITDQGVRILSDWLPRDIAGVEKVMREPGLLQQYPVK
jgi:Xaa-Pro aminopeptidase